ncbi:IPT/TIG domain-containing protein [Streptomyces sp. NBC_01262]|uniref:IPT/TIG domain-containing protein n=1 Tax=Streptomyces sp. NBC_01262 TaxID=2903803 RepID=UPI003FCC872E
MQVTVSTAGNSLNPASGPTAGGTTVVLTGSNLRSPSSLPAASVMECPTPTPRSRLSSRASLRPRARPRAVTRSL